jgi:predicted Zn-ribbon and HTH transcriptional regulator
MSERRTCKDCGEEFIPDPDNLDEEDLCPECESARAQDEQIRKFWQGY